MQRCNEGRTWIGWDFGGFLNSDVFLLYLDFLACYDEAQSDIFSILMNETELKEFS